MLDATIATVHCVLKLGRRPTVDLHAVLAVLLLLLVVLTASAQGAFLTFSDGMNAPATWDATIRKSPAEAELLDAHITTELVNGDFARVVEHDLRFDPFTCPSGGTCSPGLRLIDVFHENLQATYDPRWIGGIESLDFEISATKISTDNFNHGVSAAVQQGGKWYIGLAGDSGNERTLTVEGLKAEDFRLLEQVRNPDPDTHPDFSVGADPLTFGFYTGNTTGREDIGSIIVAYDDWQVVVQGDSSHGTLPGIPFLPTSIDNGSFVWHDLVINDPGQLTYWDPEVAVGYDYAVENNAFNSVLLPDVGDGLYDVFVWDGDAYAFEARLNAEQEYFFRGPVDRFRVAGIETGAALDPNDTQAFVTGLTFGSGTISDFSMTPITTSVATVPEPTSLILLSIGTIGLLGIGARRRRRGTPGGKK